MRLFAFRRLLLAITVLASMPSHAEQAASIRTLASDSRILAYVTSEAAQLNLLELGRKWDKKLGYECDGEYKVKIHRDLISVLKPIELSSEAAHPEAGIWQYRFGLERCGGAKIYNVLVAAMKDAPPRYAELLPGRTIASLALMKDTVPIVYSKVFLETKMKEKKECKDFAVKDTNLTVLPVVSKSDNGTLTAGPYEEAWTVRYCEADVSVPVCFTPKPGGGTALLTKRCSDAG